MVEDFSTQISGKYGTQENPNAPLFAFKEKLESAGFNIEYPVGNGMVDGFNTDLTEVGKDPHSIEFGFLMSVKKNPIHVVYNIWKDNDGYVGQSAGIEILQAMRENRPVILVRQPALAGSISEDVRNLIQAKSAKLNIRDLDNMSAGELKEYCTQVASKKVDYELTPDERATITRNTVALLREQKNNDVPK